MTKSYKHIYLSPHFDDVSLSCGGHVHRQVQADEPVLVVTICAESPAPEMPLSDFAASMHQRWGSPEDVVATRRAEDELAMEILGADHMYFDLVDCIYRGMPEEGTWYYTNNDELFGRVHPDDKILVAEVADSVVEKTSREPDVIIYAPLTVGHHVDHQLVHTAVRQLYLEGWRVAFYEDYPYADPEYAANRYNPRFGLEATLERLSPLKLQPQIQPLSEENLAAKIESIAAYASQLEMLFEDQAQMKQRIKEYALHVGQEQPAERLWIPG